MGHSVEAIQLAPEKYVLNITIPGLPATYNGIGRKSHWVAARNTQTWKQNVRLAVGRFLPAKPLERARVEIRRCSSNQGDYDGMVQAAKPVLDGLVECGVLIDDSPRIIGKPDYNREYAPRGKGFIRIQVEEVLA